MSRPLKVQIVELARTLIADEQHWCSRSLANDVNGVPISPTSGRAVKWVRLRLSDCGGL